MITALNAAGAASVVRHLWHGRGDAAMEIISLRPPGTAAAAFAEARPRYLGYSGRRAALAAPALAQALADGGYDLVHTHLAADHLAMALVRLATRVGRRAHWVSTIHNERLEGRTVRLAYRVPGAVPDGVVTISEQARRQLVADRLFRGRVGRVIHNAVDASAFSPAAPGERATLKRRLGVDDQRVLVTAVGYLRPQKDYPLLLEAVARLVRAGVDAFECAIVGDGALYGELARAIASMGLGTRVRLLGFRRDVAEILRASDVYALSSWYEGFGVAIAEAMASGLPVVATRVGGVPEVVDDGRTGLLVPPRDPDALAAALRRLLEDERLRAEMGARGRARVVERFGVARMVAQYQALYAALLAS